RRHTRLQGDWSSDVCSSDLAAVGGEHLRTIHHPLSTFETGCGLQITRVRSSAGFGQREACKLLTAYHLRKVLFLLTGITELTNSLTTGPVNGERKSGAGASLPAHLHRRDVNRPWKLKAPKIFWKAHAGESLLEEFPNVLSRKLCLNVDLTRCRLDLLLEEISQRLEEQQIIFRC